MPRCSNFQACAVSINKNNTSFHEIFYLISFYRSTHPESTFIGKPATVLYVLLRENVDGRQAHVHTNII